MDQYPGKAHLEVDASYYNLLDIHSFSLMMKDPSCCYKFYWLEAIVNLISEGIRETTFNDIIDEMICNAWYSVREFHIHLSGLSGDGSVRDGLERAILRLSELSELPSNASEVEIKNEIRRHNRELYDAKEQLTHMVPYRALAAYFPTLMILTAVISKWNRQKEMLKAWRADTITGQPAATEWRLG